MIPIEETVSASFNCFKGLLAHLDVNLYKILMSVGLKRKNTDKFYTNTNVVNLCINNLKKYININPGDLCIEPSAGSSGSFISQIKIIM